LATLAVAGATAAVQLPAHALHLPHTGAAGVLQALALISAVVGAYVGYVRLIERRRVIELGRAGAVTQLARGYLLGTGLFCATVLTLCLLGIGTISRGDGWRAVPAGLAAALAAAFAEEILIRGVVFRIVEESLGSWIALAFSAALFGGLHAFNPGATFVSTLSIALEAGVLLAAAYVYSRTLWLPIGLHTAWNFTEGGLFGASVSGGPQHGLLRSDFAGRALLTGGEFGPESSVVAVVICLAAGLALLVLAQRRQRLVPPWWRRAA
jgi:membrane protease YdiL (CAAX protease family)